MGQANDRQTYGEEGAENRQMERRERDAKKAKDVGRKDVLWNWRTSKSN